MSIRPMDTQNVYLRMGEVSREQDKEIKKEEREQGFQNQVRKSREANSGQTVGQVKEAHADQTVREHEDRALPVRKKRGDEESADEQGRKGRESDRENRQKQAEDMALPLAVLGRGVLSKNAVHKGKFRDLDPDLGWHINIES